MGCNYMVSNVFWFGDGGWLGFRTGFRMEFRILESKGFEYLNRKEVFLFGN